MLKSFTLAATLALSGLSFGDDIPFWGDAEPATNRTFVAFSSVVLQQKFESRLYVDFGLQLWEFNSTKLGFLLLFK